MRGGPRKCRSLAVSQGFTVPKYERYERKCIIFFFLHAHAARGAEGSYNRCCDTGNHLYYKLNGLFLCHNFNGLIG